MTISRVKFDGVLPVDAFSRVQIGLPGYLFDSQFTYKLDTDLWDTQLSSGSSAAHSATERWVTLTTNSGGAHHARLQGHYHAPYTPGRSQGADITFLFGSAPAVGVTRRAGYYDGANGVYFEQTSTGHRFVLATSTSDGTETIEADDWNEDTLDGSGPSRVDLDLTKTQIMAMDMQALYVGKVRVGFVIDGFPVWAHSFLHSNLASFPYIAQASLPVRYEVTTTGPAGSMNAICASVFNNAGDSIYDIPGRVFSCGNGITSIGVTTRRPILTIRALKQLNSINQNAVIIPIATNLLVRTNDAYVELVRNGTLGVSPSYAAVNTGSSVIERSIDATTIANGTVIDEFYVPASASVRGSLEKSISGKALLAYSHMLDAGDTLSIVVTARTGTTDVHGSLVWKEIR